MASDIKRVTDHIQRLAGRTSSVRIGEIEWVVKQLKKFGYSTTATKHDHGIFFTVNSQRFNVCTHHKGSSQVRPFYVTGFLKAMIELRLYEG